MEIIFSENDIRPKKFDADKLKAIQADIDWLTEKKIWFVSVDCPACAGKDYNQEFEKFGFHFDRCNRCRTVFMNPRPSEAILGDFYTRSEVYKYWDTHIFPASREVRREKIFRPRLVKILELCKKFNISADTLVDVGSASGMFCQEALESHKFKRVIGIEPSVSQADTCRKYGIEVVNKPVEAVSHLKGRADVVTCFETIEHVFDPGKFIEWCTRLLTPGGLLVLTCPNYEGFDVLTLGVKSESLDAEHINLFNPDSIVMMIEKHGLTVMECETPGQLDAEIVRNKALSNEIDLKCQPFLHKILVMEWKKHGHPFQEYLKSNMMSSHMWVVSRNT